ncbi:hypothetical protein LZ575_16770 [Antarcticibacterium sp. 1MA-6-2]|uniref:hypothetical protein n=1 Tax=Antarcticibacterium sp. 1MA-6-2 TaxID=2908210 RepID=UPI001F2B184F|nr:hypothetical protein [Antarcticibacterium sp. 1MA-6-2]UJH90456.1 hypothetical protein LZ575_16770 [Antarcticibacterium sp. 1MA-6-2]
MRKNSNPVKLKPNKMNKMEVKTLVARNSNRFFLLSFFLFASCAAQKKQTFKEEKIYSLLEHHYALGEIEDSGKFLYNQTISIKDNPNFEWTKQVTLSEFLNDSIFEKKCQEIQKLLDNEEQEELNNRFASLESKRLDENKFSKNVLNRKFLLHETYEKAPNAASRKVSYPIIFTAKNHICGLFVEDAHNEGGNLYFYKLEDNEWKLVCKDSLWRV